MSYYHTGQARNKTLTIVRGDQSRPYNLAAAFTDPRDDEDWPALTDTEFQRLSAEEFEARLEAFCEKVYLENPGLRDDCPDLASGCIVWNTSLCPLPTAQQQQEQ